MRTAIAVATQNGNTIRVHGIDGEIGSVRLLILDRIANEVAFDGETAVRLPRRLGVDLYRPGHPISERRLSDGSISRNVM